MTVDYPSTRSFTSRPEKLLETALRENALFSVASGLFLLVAGSWIDDWIGVNRWMLMAAGAGLIGFAAFVGTGASSPKRLSITGRSAIAGDVGWIVGAVVIVAATDWLTANGEIALLAVSVPVAAFATAQTMGLRRLDRSDTQV